jgi:uncharacterized membrane protein
LVREPIPVTGTRRAPLGIAMTAAAVGWVVLILTTPVALAHGRLPWATLPVYEIGGLVCHQRPERSFHLAGVQLPVCARCFGLYAAGAAGLVLASIRRARISAASTRAALALAAVPIASTVALEWTGAIATSNLVRFLTGLPLGFVAGAVVAWLLDADEADCSGGTRITRIGEGRGSHASSG